jgi:hypothetical protein
MDIERIILSWEPSGCYKYNDVGILISRGLAEAPFVYAVS